MEDLTDGCGAEAFRRADHPELGDEVYRPDTLQFALQFKDELSQLRIMSLFVLPDEEVEIEAILGDPESRFQACAQGGEIRRLDAGRWLWRAPSEPGVHSLYVTDVRSEETMRLNAFVMVPYHGETELEGYRIGSYEKVPLRDNPVYSVPRGMVEVRRKDLDLRLTPHFRLRQFLCKQKSSFPKLAIVGERMLLKLEMLLEEVNQRGLQARTFAILSGFRTPFYNAAIGNRTRYSRHTYGDAADIFIDEDGDGRMDDLNGDGRVDVADARLLYDLVEDLFDETPYKPFIGGLGLYGPKPHRGPFIHVDTRGFKARWQQP